MEQGVLNRALGEVLFHSRDGVPAVALEDRITDGRAGIPVAEDRAAEAVGLVIRKRAARDDRRGEQAAGNRATLTERRVVREQAVLHGVMNVAAVEADGAAGTPDSFRRVVCERAILDRRIGRRDHHAAADVDADADLLAHELSAGQVVNIVQEAISRGVDQGQRGFNFQCPLPGHSTAAESGIAADAAALERHGPRRQEQSAPALGPVVQEVAIRQRRDEVLEMHGAALAEEAFDRLVAAEGAAFQIHRQNVGKLRVGRRIIGFDGAAVLGGLVAGKGAAHDVRVAEQPDRPAAVGRDVAVEVALVQCHFRTVRPHVQGAARILDRHGDGLDNQPFDGRHIEQRGLRGQAARLVPTERALPDIDDGAACDVHGAALAVRELAAQQGNRGVRAGRESAAPRVHEDFALLVLVQADIGGVGERRVGAIAQEATIGEQRAGVRLVDSAAGDCAVAQHGSGQPVTGRIRIRIVESGPAAARAARAFLGGERLVADEDALLKDGVAAVLTIDGAAVAVADRAAAVTAPALVAAALEALAAVAAQAADGAQRRAVANRTVDEPGLAAAQARQSAAIGRTRGVTAVAAPNTVGVTGDHEAAQTVAAGGTDHGAILDDDVPDGRRAGILAQDRAAVAHAGGRRAGGLYERGALSGVGVYRTVRIDLSAGNAAGSADRADPESVADGQARDDGVRGLAAVEVERALGHEARAGAVEDRAGHGLRVVRIGRHDADALGGQIDALRIDDRPGALADDDIRVAVAGRPHRLVQRRKFERHEQVPGAVQLELDGDDHVARADRDRIRVDVPGGVVIRANPPLHPVVLVGIGGKVHLLTLIVPAPVGIDPAGTDHPHRQVVLRQRCKANGHAAVPHHGHRVGRRGGGVVIRAGPRGDAVGRVRTRGQLDYGPVAVHPVVGVHGPVDLIRIRQYTTLVIDHDDRQLGQGFERVVIADIEPVHVADGVGARRVEVGVETSYGVVRVHAAGIDHRTVHRLSGRDLTEVITQDEVRVGEEVPVSGRPRAIRIVHIAGIAHTHRFPSVNHGTGIHEDRYASAEHVDRAGPHGEDVPARQLAPTAAVNQSGRGRRIQESTGHAGTLELVECPEVAAAVREAGSRAEAAESVRAAAGVARLPLNPGIVELDVKIARGPVGTVDQNQLEAVGPIPVGREITDAHPVDAEGGSSADEAGAVSHHRIGVGIDGAAQRPGIHVGKERRDDGRADVAGQAEWREGHQRHIEGHVAVVVHVELVPHHAEVVQLETDVHEPGGLVIVGRQGELIEPGPDHGRRIRIDGLRNRLHIQIDVRVYDPEPRGQRHVRVAAAHRHLRATKADVGPDDRISDLGSALIGIVEAAPVRVQAAERVVGDGAVGNEQVALPIVRDAAAVSAGRIAGNQAVPQHSPLSLARRQVHAAAGGDRRVVHDLAVLDALGSGEGVDAAALGRRTRVSDPLNDQIRVVRIEIRVDR